MSSPAPSLLQGMGIASAMVVGGSEKEGAGEGSGSGGWRNTSPEKPPASIAAAAAVAAVPALPPKPPPVALPLPPKVGWI